MYYEALLVKLHVRDTPLTGSVDAVSLSVVSFIRMNI
jgi:hypothetical protein